MHVIQLVTSPRVSYANNVTQLLTTPLLRELHNVTQLMTFSAYRPIAQCHPIDDILVTPKNFTMSPNW